MSKKRNAPRSLGNTGVQSMTLEQFTAMGYGDLESLVKSPGVSALVADDGSIRVGRFKLNPTGLEVESDATFEEWQYIGGILHRLEGSINWLIGDWLVYGERVWGQTYEQVSEITGFDVKTLYQYAWIARNVDFSVRTENLSFGHHQLIAGLEPDLQRRWLAHAEENNLSISQLRKALADTPPTLPQVSPQHALFSPEIKRNFTKMFRLGIKAGQGDKRARDKFLSQISDFRHWLDQVERVVSEEND